jgi:hypothetical protein
MDSGQFTNIIVGRIKHIFGCLKASSVLCVAAVVAAAAITITDFVLLLLDIRSYQLVHGV